MLSFHEGQEVLLLERRNRGHTRTFVTISKVGRKYAYVTVYGNPVPFSLETGVEAAKGNYPMRIATAETLAVEDHRRAVIARITAVKWGRAGYGHWPESTETLEKIADLLEQDAARL